MRTFRNLIITAALLTAESVPVSAWRSKLDQLKETMKSMEHTIEQMKQNFWTLGKRTALVRATTPSARELT